MGRLPSKSTIFVRPGKLLQLRCQSLVLGKKKTFGNVSKMIHNRDIIERDESGSSKREHFDTNTGLIDVLIKAYDQAESWQTKRQILSLFANDSSHKELQTLIPVLTWWRID